jgi:hypothetical protein
MLYCAGELDEDLAGLEAPSLHFNDPVEKALSERALSKQGSDFELLEQLHERATELGKPIRRFIQYNMLDFSVAAPSIDDYNHDFGQSIGLDEENWLILELTRVVPRTGIKLAIELVRRPNNPRTKLIITHRADDEGLDYLNSLRQLEHEKHVDLRFIADIVNRHRG